MLRRIYNSIWWWAMSIYAKRYGVPEGEERWVDDDEYAQLEDTAYDGKGLA